MKHYFIVAPAPPWRQLGLQIAPSQRALGVTRAITLLQAAAKMAILASSGEKQEKQLIISIQKKLNYVDLTSCFSKRYWHLFAY